MILIILVIALLLFLVLSILWHRGRLLKTIVCSGLFIMAIACSLTLMLNDVSHLGMKTVAVSTTNRNITRLNYIHEFETSMN